MVKTCFDEYESDICEDYQTNDADITKNYESCTNDDRNNDEGSE